jgi:hypothetical protein
MTYSPPKIKSEGCFYPNCDGYLSVPFCCKDPLALPAIKDLKVNVQAPKKEWVGLTDEEIKETWLTVYKITDATDAFAYAIEAKLKEKNS